MVRRNKPTLRINIWQQLWWTLNRQNQGLKRQSRPIQRFLQQKFARWLEIHTARGFNENGSNDSPCDNSPHDTSALDRLQRYRGRESTRAAAGGSQLNRLNETFFRSKFWWTVVLTWFLHVEFKILMNKTLPDQIKNIVSHSCFVQLLSAHYQWFHLIRLIIHLELYLCWSGIVRIGAFFIHLFIWRMMS